MEIKNSKGEVITLNQREKLVADYNQKIVNALGYEVDITTLTTIMKKVTEQKFFQIPFAEYLPVKVGEGAWSSNLVTYRSFALGDDFATGVMNTGANAARVASADAGVDSITVKVANWAKSISWSLFDLQQAAKAGNWDLVTAKEKARKKNWDLGVQKVAFLGLKGDAGLKGLLTQSDVNINTTLITKKLSSMSTTELTTFTAGIVEAYRANCNRTAMPTHFIIPESDYNGLASTASADFPIKTKMEILLDMFKAITMNKSFKLLPVAYADPAYSESLLSKERYTLMNYEEESIRMDIPVDYTSTLANSIDNFNFQNVGYGQLTGAKAYRPLEMLYLDLTAGQ